LKWPLVALAGLAAVYGVLQLVGARESGPLPLFPAFRAEAATKISLRGPGGGAVLEKRGGIWVAASEGSYPAEADAVERMLEAVQGFSRKDMISSNPDKQALYQVDTTGVAVAIEGAGGKVLAAFVVGKLGPDYQSTYVRAANSKRVILAPGHLSSVFPSGKPSWQDKRIFAYQAADLTEIGIEKPGTSLVLRRASDGKWVIGQPEGAECDANKANRLARALAGLRSEDFAGHAPVPRAGVDRPDSSVSFKTSGGAEEKLVIGHGADGGRFYAAKGKGDVVYLLGAQNVKTLLADVAELTPKPPEVQE
jgi:hypothetical protein